MQTQARLDRVGAAGPRAALLASGSSLPGTPCREAALAKRNEQADVFPGEAKNMSLLGTWSKLVL